MRTSLKRSEIIEQLHRLLGAKVVEIFNMSTIDMSKFDKYYILIVRYNELFQVVIIHLHFGWIQFELSNCRDSLADSKKDYIREISSVENQIRLTYDVLL